MVHLLPLFIVLWDAKIKSKPGGCAPRRRLTLLLAQKSKQKGPTLRWARLARQVGNINKDYSGRSRICTSPTGSEALESLSFCGGLQQLLCF